LNNQEVASILEEYAELLELEGEDAFRLNAYRRASKAIRNLEEDVTEVWRQGKLEDIPGIGQAISKKVDEIIRTGGLKALDQLRSQIPKGLLELTSVPFIGPKTARLLYTKFGVKGRADLLAKLRDNSLVDQGFSKKLADKLLGALGELGESSTKMLLVEAMDHASRLINDVGSDGAFELYVCGSIRRGKELVGDVDLVVVPKTEGKTLLDLAQKLRGGMVLARGQSKLTWVSPAGVQFDFRLAKREQLGAMKLYFTGSKDHNVALRTHALKMGYKLSEFGLFRRDGTLVGGASEEEIYSELGLQYIEPELRENTGEIDAASEGRLPVLVDANQVYGDYHVHSNWSDGSDTLDRMVEAALRQGYKYIVFTDHSKNERVANGMTEERLMRQAREIDKLRSKYGSIEILHGSEVDILRDGRLDYDDATLRRLDYVVASLHKKFSSDPDVLTEAVVKALTNRYVDALGHPTNRLLGKRPENGVKLQEVIVAAKNNSKFLEVDGQPRRMDLPSQWIKRAVEEGVQVVLSSDAHSAPELSYMMFALINARRGWASAKNVANTSTKFRGARSHTN
jgi:DNA polymerase (family 10)